MKIAIDGCGGFGREVAPVARDLGAEVLFVSDDPAQHGPGCCGLDDLPAEYDVVIAVADSRIRGALAARCEAAGRRFGTLQSRSAERLGWSEVGEGAILCGFTVISDNVRIGGIVGRLSAVGTRLFEVWLNDPMRGYSQIGSEREEFLTHLAMLEVEGMTPYYRALNPPFWAWLTGSS